MKPTPFLLLAVIASLCFASGAWAGPCQEDCGKPQAPTASIYENIGAGNLATDVAKALPRVYVPNGLDGTVSVIDSTSLEVVDTIKVGLLPQHVVPSWDLKTLWLVLAAARTG